ncbi:hypothetical protein SSX86_016030 [Deinandra increscens subsp. villosa]|uniref:PPM-type phosphatase domain-containing protein n=1 Tax=Deinandra increscens subsp. villosa TaxID=3103831 RepID=A0AAP0GV97_9ASTR
MHNNPPPRVFILSAHPRFNTHLKFKTPSSFSLSLSTRRLVLFISISNQNPDVEDGGGSDIRLKVANKCEDEIAEAVRERYLATNSEFLEEDTNGGACCVTTLICKGNLIVINAGDSGTGLTRLMKSYKKQMAYSFLEDRRIVAISSKPRRQKHCSKSINELAFKESPTDLDIMKLIGLGSTSAKFKCSDCIYKF